MSPAQGDAIVNVARVASAESPDVLESAPATVVAYLPVPATIELLQEAPLAAGARAEPVVPGAWRAGPAEGDAFTAQPPPRRAGAAAPLDLGASLRLAPASQYHQGDPIFIRVTDLDQDLDRTSRETLVVTLVDDLTGDVETVRLTEDGPDTGVFVGYVQSVRSSTPARDGLLAVVDASRITASYVDRRDATDITAAAALVDPAGLVFDSRTGQPVSGAAVTVIDVASGLPAEVFGDDGTSTFPSTVASGGTAQDSLGRGYTFAPGGYRFPFLRPGTYRLQVSAPPGYRSPSVVPAEALQTLPGAPFEIVAGSRGDPFTLQTGPALRIDLPLDAASGALFVQKTAGKLRVAVGDFLPYQVDVTNRDASAGAPGVRLVDVLPAGFRYRRGSARVGEVPAGDPSVTADGRTLTFELGTVAAGQTASLRYAAEVGAGARAGVEAVNLARATSAAGAASNTARAGVLVIDPFFTDRTFVMGRVTTGACDARDGVGDEGVAQVRVLLEDGTFAMTDRRGLYHFEGLKPGTHVVQLDLDSLPPGATVVPCTENDRFAGRAFSQLVDVQGGAVWRADFHVERPAPPPAPVAPPAEPPPPPPPPPPPEPAAAVPAPAPGVLAVRLLQQVEPLAVALQVHARGSEARGDLRLAVALPDGLVYEPGSSSLDGAPLPDPEPLAGGLRYVLGPVDPGWSKVVALRARVARDALAGPRTVEVTAELAAGEVVSSTPTSRATLAVVREAESARVTLHPHFASLSADLEAADLAELRRVAGTLQQSRPDRILVVGHTDSQRINGAARKRFADNGALSLARARTVGRALSEALHLSSDQLETEGRGEAEPVADNATAEGRARNRRVEVSLLVSTPDANAALRAVRDGDEVRADVPAVLSVVVPVPDPAVPVPAVPVPAVPVAAVPATTATVAAAPATPTPTPIPSPAPTATDPAPPPDGLASPVNGELLADRVVAVQLRLPSSLVAKLQVDGKEVPSSRIGYKREDPQTGKTDYTFVGVDFGERGPHAVLVTGVDPFGNERFRQEATVTRVGQIASIRLVESGENVADGKTPIRLRFEVLDASGDPVRGSTRLQIREGTLQGYRREADALADPDAPRRPYMDRDGWVLFQPVGTAGPYRALVACGAATVEAETWVLPRMRDWVLVGLAEGTVGHEVVSGNLASLDAADASARDLWKDGRVAFYAKGQVQGKWLVTLAADSARTATPGRPGLFQILDPQQYYTVYGDGSLQGQDAPSARKVYVRIEREQFYALFGDYDTGLAATDLSRYSRRLNGVKAELQSRAVEVKAFAARTDKAYARDELPGDGTSGLYRLSGPGLTLGSEVVTIVTRDRFHSERVVSSRTLVRFLDYSIDYDAGTLFFREPIPSRDEHLDPVTIVVEYERPSGGAEDYTAGGRVGVKLLDQRIRAGVTAVHEGMGERRNDLLGVDARVQLSKETRFHGEVAGTESRAAGTTRTGEAWLAEVQHAGRAFDARLYLREQESGFGLGQQPLPEAGTRKVGLDTAVRVDERLGFTGQAYRQDFFANGASRTAAEARATWRAAATSAYAGALDASDTLRDGSGHHSGQLVAGGKLLTAAERLTLGLDLAQSAWGNGNADYPTRVAARAEYKLTPAVALVGVQELTWGAVGTTRDTRVGLQSMPWEGGSLSAAMEQRLNENAERVLGNVGLRQTWQVSREWKLDAGLERSQTLRHQGYYQVQPTATARPASGSLEDFTAVTTGAAYQVQGLVAEARAEARTSTTEDKWTLHSGAVAELANGWGISGRAQVLASHGSGGSRGSLGDARLGLVYRPPRTRWILLQRLDYVVERRTAGAGGAGTGVAAVPTATGALGDTDSWRLVENLVANYRPSKALQASLGLGVRYLRERVTGDLQQGFSDQLSAEARRDLSARWDVGVRGSVLHTWSTGATAFSAGPSVGYSPVTNAWVSVGFNVTGYRDRDFSAAEYTAMGPYLKVRFKFDQESIVEAGRWINRQ